MNILIANDDGIFAEGIRKLTDALSQVADVYVCAPTTQKSACGHGITIHNTIKVEEVEYEKAKRAYSIDGTPADCVKIGLELLSDKGVDIDMVFSGINMGGNMGTDVLYSGTVSAAMEGALCGKPSVALSVDALRPKHFGTAMKLAKDATKLDYKNMDKEVIININVPDLPEEELKGVKVIGLGVREYEEWFQIMDSDDGHDHYKYAGRPVFREDYGSDSNDIGASQAGYATVTPLHYDLTNYRLLEQIKNADVFSLD